MKEIVCMIQKILQDLCPTSRNNDWHKTNIIVKICRLNSKLNKPILKNYMYIVYLERFADNYKNKVNSIHI